MPPKPKKNIRRRRFGRNTSKRRLDVNMSAVRADNSEYLKSFATEQGNILSRRITGMTAKNHRKLTRAIKQARTLLLFK